MVERKVCESMETNEYCLNHLCDALDNLKLQRPDELYNYVGYDLLQKFFCDKADISCGSIIDMNDRYEVKFGANKILRQWMDSGVITAKAYETLKQNIEINYDRGRSLIKPQQVLMPYVFCMSSLLDSAYMWRNYITDPEKGGYCICFNSQLLQDAINVRNKQFNSTLSLVPVFYGEQNEEEISILSAALAADVYDDIKLFNDSPMCADEAAKRIMGSVFSLAPYIKEKQWAKEQEWRLLLLNEDCRSIREEGKIERQNTHLMDTGFPPAYFMTSIMISPQGNEQLLRENIAQFLTPEEECRLPKSKLSRSVVKNYIEIGEVEDDDTVVDFLKYQEFVLDETAKNGRAEMMSFIEFRERILGDKKEEFSNG